MALTLATVLTLAATAPRAQDAGILPANVIFVTSTGYWEDSGDPLEALAPSTSPSSAQTAPAAETPEEAAPLQRGYYKLIAVRQTDGTAQIHLQQIASSAEGPKVVSSAELEEFSNLKAYVTDIRPESSTGVSLQPGLFATVYLKTDPQAAEPDSWTVLIDDIGDIKVERATN
ncbi:hypothetical protein [Pararhizobium antarcticum]|uniref:Uncharacterized protein n=1 Tax=Pararhizobium antarcticum TaxID=1798805 RepID=A0A657LPT6_9HYPH|nr:hypothetical protein [Pararhizobium antarcticum]OJF90097.1 hypothetical protein AX760_24570 [Pararhizobium antarcticum]OJF90627.1 hypothetical protein AX761_23395 [Rhizobium sp. 58]